MDKNLTVFSYYFCIITLPNLVKSSSLLRNFTEPLTAVRPLQLLQFLFIITCLSLHTKIFNLEWCLWSESLNHWKHHQCGDVINLQQQHRRVRLVDFLCPFLTNVWCVEDREVYTHCYSLQTFCCSLGRRRKSCRHGWLIFRKNKTTNLRYLLRLLCQLRSEVFADNK